MLTHILPQLRRLAPKASPVQRRLQLEHHNIWDEQDTEAPPTATTDIPSVPNSGHVLTSPPPLSPDSTVSSLERKQYAVVAPCTNAYSNRAPLSSANDSLPELACGNLLSGVVTRESRDPPTRYSPYGDLQLQEAIQNRQGQDYWIPMLGTPEVWTAMVLPTIGVHQSPCSIRILTQYDSMQGKMIAC